MKFFNEFQEVGLVRTSLTVVKPQQQNAGISNSLGITAAKT